MSEFKPSGRVVIAGGSGFLGLNLAHYLCESGCEVVILSRSEPARGAWSFARWDGRSLGAWADELDGATALVNLAGRTVDCIKTPDHCDEILRSRTESTAVLGQALRKVKNPPKVWVQMSTAHIYGDPPEAVCDEDSEFGFGLAPIVGKAWEETFARSVLPEMRQVILRTSFVMGRTGGALSTLARLTRLGLGGKIGSGRQGMSWIHAADMNRIMAQGIADETMSGVYVATAPNPVSNRAFMQALRKALRCPIGLPAPEWLVRLGAPLVMKTDPEIALYGRYCVSRKLKEDGFEFRFPDIDAAFADLFEKT